MNFREKAQTYLHQVIDNREHGLLATLLRFFLGVVSFLYGLLLQVRGQLYRRRFLQPERLPCMVISLGNITLGGTGKTPTARRLATHIRDMGYQVSILSRGYKSEWKGAVGLVSDGKQVFMSAAEAGDEAVLLANSLPGVSVVIGPKRVVSGEYAVEHLGAQVLILDDAFQHWQLDRDMDIVLIDAAMPFGNGQVLPRGILREPLAGLSRAQVFLLTKVDQVNEEKRRQLRNLLSLYNPQALLVDCMHKPSQILTLTDWAQGSDALPLEQSLRELAELPVMALSAIGSPQSFEQTLRSLGLNLVDCIRYSDHHHYQRADLEKIAERARQQDVKAVLLTEKDAVKLPPDFVRGQQAIPFYLLKIELQFGEGEQEFMQLLQHTLEKKVPQ